MMLDAHPAARDPARDALRQPVHPGVGRLRFNPRTRDQDDRRRRAPALERLRARGGGPAGRASRQVEPFNTTDALRAFYGLYADKHGKPRWGDKTPDYIRKMKKLQKTLPEARFIHVIRDGRDAGPLAERPDRSKRGKDPVPPREMARRWRKRIVKSRDRRRGRSSTTSRSATRTWSPTPRPSCGASASTSSSTTTRRCSATTSAPRSACRRWPGALPAKKGRPEREAGERVAAHALTTKPPRRRAASRSGSAR